MTTAVSRARQASLVLGGTGFIGRHLVAALADRGDDVRVVCRQPVPAGALSNASRVSMIAADYGATVALRPLLDGVTTVFHLASSTQPKSSNDDMVADVRSNLLPSIALMEEVVRGGRARIVFVSSGGTVYGVPKEIPIPETHPTDALCSYGIVKLAIEKYLNLHEALNGLDQRILRVSNPYGPGQHRNQAQGVIGNFIQQLSLGRRLSVWGDGSVVRDFIYIDDVVTALLLADTHCGSGRVFNIGSGTGHRLADVIAVIGAAVGCDPQIDFLPGRAFDIPVNVLDISAAQRDLGWKPRVTLADGIRRTVESLRGAA